MYVTVVFDSALGEGEEFSIRVLSMGMRQMKRDWAEQKGVEPVLVETFVEKGRFFGHCLSGGKFSACRNDTGTRQTGRGMSMRCRSKTSIFIRYIPMQVSTCVRDRRRGCRSGGASDWAQEEFGNTNLGT
ncbi:MAG: hypothetical protein HRU72_00035 [Planctomycetia bacterium]|nr:MAG: hypothetical protein HRU72_00035 [Planctomycetia bacterium]